MNNVNVLLRKKSLRDFFKVHYELSIYINQKKSFHLQILNHNNTTRYPPQSFIIKNLVGEVVAFGKRIQSDNFIDDCEVTFFDGIETKKLRISHFNGKVQFCFNNNVLTVNFKTYKFSKWVEDVSFNGFIIKLAPSNFSTQATVVFDSDNESRLLPVILVFLLGEYAKTLYNVG